MLIVVAHPEPQSFNATLAGTAADAWRAGGHAVTVANLYGETFDPCEAPRHYADRRDPPASTRSASSAITGNAARSRPRSRITSAC